MNGQHLIKHGLTLNAIPHHGLSGAEISGSVLFGPTFYTITGFHGAHVTGGVIYLIVILIQGMRGNLHSRLQPQSRDSGTLLALR